MGREHRDRRGWVIASAGALCLLGSSAALFGATVLPMPKWRIGVLSLFGVGGLLAILAGWIAGRGFLRFLRRRRVFVGLLILDAVVSAGSVFAFLCSFSGHPVIDHGIAEAMVTALTVVLVVANSYAVGHLLLSHRIPTSRGRRLAAVVLLYGSILAGVIVHRWNSPPWETVSVVPIVPDARKPVAELLAEAREEPSRPEVSVNMTYQGSLHIEQEEWQKDHLDLGRTILHDDAVNAGGTRVEPGGGSIEVIGIELRTWKHSLLKNAGENRFWNPEGNPISGESLPRTETSSMEGPVVVVFYVRADGGLDIARLHFHELVLAGSGSPVAYQPFQEYAMEQGAGEDGVVSIRFVLQLPVPGPLELRILAVHEEEIATPLPREIGRRIDIARNNIQFAGAFEGFFDLGGGHFGGGKIRSYLPPLPTDDKGNATTAVFTSALSMARDRWEMRFYGTFGAASGRLPERFPLVPRIRAVLTDGRVLEPVSMRFEWHCILVEYECALEDIESFSIVERPRITQVRFPIENLPFMPEENRGVENLLDLRFPYRVQDGDELRKTLMGTWPTRYAYLPPSDGQLFRAPGPNATLRDLLDAYYPGQWMVKESKISRRERECLRKRLQEALFGAER